MLVSQGPAAEQHQQDRFRTCINRTRCPLQPGSGRGPAATPKPFVAPCGLGQYRGCPLARARQRACVSPQTFLFLQFGQASDAFSQGPAQGQHYQHQDQIAFVSAGLCLHYSDARLLAKAQQRASISSISPQPFLPLRFGPASERCLQPSSGRGPASAPERFGPCGLGQHQGDAFSQAQAEGQHQTVLARGLVLLQHQLANLLATQPLSISSTSLRVLDHHPPPSRFFCRGPSCCPKPEHCL